MKTDENSRGKTVGFSLLALLALQDALGLLKHFVFTGSSTIGSLFGPLHCLVGVSLVSLGVRRFPSFSSPSLTPSPPQFHQVHLGIARYGTTSDLVTYGLFACVPRLPFRRSFSFLTRSKH